MNKVICAVSVISLCACLTPIDLAKDESSLPYQDQVIAKKMADLVAKRCPRYTCSMDTGARLSGNVGISIPAIVKRFYTSTNSTWYKAHGVSENVWDDFFYNKTSGEFVCGAKSWSNKSNVSHVIFNEVMANNRESAAPPSEKDIPPCVTFRNGQQMTCTQANEHDHAIVRARKGNAKKEPTTSEQRLMELKVLFDKGLINKDQYEKKRTEIIDAL